jgi:hypothetical protein
MIYGAKSGRKAQGIRVASEGPELDGVCSGRGTEWGPRVKTREVLTTNEPRVPPDGHDLIIEAFDL